MKKKTKVPQIRIYLDDDLLLDRIANIAQALDTNMSNVGKILLKNGIDELEQNTERIIRKRIDETKKNK